MAVLKYNDIFGVQNWTTVTTFTNSWSQLSANTVGYTKLGNNIVVLQGIVTGGTVGSAAFTLPVGFRPDHSLDVATRDESGGGYAAVRIGSDGTVTPVASPSSLVTYSINALFYAAPAASGITLTNLGTSADNTATFDSAPTFPTIASTDIAKIIVEPNTANEEIIYLSPYTAGATTGTVLRAQEGTAKVAHTSAAWVHGPTAADMVGDAAWTVVGATGAPAFQNSWSSSAGPVQFRKLSSGMVLLCGLVAGGTAGTTAFTLPVGYRPASQRICFGWGSSAATGEDVSISAAGAVAPGSSAGGSVWLDNVSFYAEQ